jgi:GT2 family glycosyltransferase
MDMERGSFCLIAAHDAAPSPDCLKLLVSAAGIDKKIGIASPQYPDATVPRLSGRRGIYYEAGAPSGPGAIQYVEAPHGTLMLCRRECLRQIGFFDERYFAYGDEHELGVRARRNGWNVVIVWGAIVINPGTWTESPLRSYLFARNSLLLVRDYCGGGSAFLRAVMILLNTLRLMIKPPNKDFAFSWRARFRAVRDYFLGRWGKPDFAR